MGNARYTLKGLADAVGVSTHTIRHYVRTGLLHTAVREGSSSLFNDTHVARMKDIASLRSAGHRGPDLVARLRERAAQAAQAKAAPPPAPVRTPTTRHAVDAAVCAAAEVLDVSPRGLRAALAAVFRTLDEANVTLADAGRLVAADDRATP
jgi:DNA-binding transcriptional MerR regulator